MQQNGKRQVSQSLLENQYDVLKNITWYDNGAESSLIEEEAKSIRKLPSIFIGRNHE